MSELADPGFIHQLQKLFGGGVEIASVFETRYPLNSSYRIGQKHLVSCHHLLRRDVAFVYLVSLTKREVNGGGAHDASDWTRVKSRRIQGAIADKK